MPKLQINSTMKWNWNWTILFVSSVLMYTSFFLIVLPNTHIADPPYNISAIGPSLYSWTVNLSNINFRSIGRNSKSTNACVFFPLSSRKSTSQNFIFSLKSFKKVPTSSLVLIQFWFFTNVQLIFKIYFIVENIYIINTKYNFKIIYNLSNQPWLGNLSILERMMISNLFYLWFPT